MSRFHAILCQTTLALSLLTVPAFAGPVGGPRQDTHRVDCHSRDLFKLKFYEDERAAVVVIGDGDTDLDLYIYDAYGNLVACDTGDTDDCIVTFTPSCTGTFRIVVLNRGSVYNDYAIAVR